MTAGVLTLAYGPAEYLRMAKGLGRSVRLRNPGTQIALVTDRQPSAVDRWFDIVIPLNPSYGPGLAQKLHLDQYNPFDETLYIDADVLVYRDLTLVWDQFRNIDGFGLAGFYLLPGESHYSVEDLPAYLAKLGISRILMTNTGIMYYDRSPTATAVFEKAREVARNASALGLRLHPAGFFNDEPIFGAVVELLGLPFVAAGDHRDPAASGEPLLTLACFGTEGMFGIDVRRGIGEHVLSGRALSPYAIHFNVESQLSYVYDRELRRLEFGSLLGRTPAPDVATAVLRHWPKLVKRLRS